MAKGICDKCGQPVKPDNDAIMLASMAGNFLADTGYSRHLLPVAGCEGSPSRYQYLEGEPRDQRGYPYDEEWESRYRNAYDELKEF